MIYILAEANNKTIKSELNKVWIELNKKLIACDMKSSLRNYDFWEACFIS